MHDIVLYLAIERDGQNPLAIGRVTDRDVVELAAVTAIEEVRAAASQPNGGDPVLADIRRRALSSLEQSLRLLIPEVQPAQTQKVM